MSSNRLGFRRSGIEAVVLGILLAIAVPAVGQDANGGADRETIDPEVKALIEQMRAGDLDDRIGAIEDVAELDGAAAAIPTLVTLSSDASAEVREAAIYALGDMFFDAGTCEPTEAARAALVRALQDADAPVRTAAVVALSAEKVVPPASVAALIGRVKDGDASVRKLVGDGLDRLRREQPEVEQALLEQLTDPDPEIRLGILEVLLHREKDAAALLVPRLLPFLEEDDPRLRCAALRVLRRSGPAAKPAEASAVGALESDDDLERREAVLLLSELDDPPAAAVPGLLTALEASDPITRAHAATVLGELRATAAVPKLRKLIHDENREAWASGIWALGQMGEAALPAAAELVQSLASSRRRVPHPALAALDAIGVGVVPHLLAAMGTDEDEFRSHLCSALAQRTRRDPAFLSRLREALAGDDPSVQLTAIAVMHFLRERAAPALPELIEAVEAQNMQVAKNALRAISRLGAEAEPAIPTLVDVVASGNRYLAPWARGSLIQFGPQATGLLLPLLAHESVIVRMEAARVLCYMKAPQDEAIEPLRKALLTRNLETREAACIALGRYGAKASSALGYLTQLVAKSEHAAVRSAACHALWKIAPEDPSVVDAVRPLLEDASSDVRHEAVLAFDAMGEPAAEVVPQLTALLDGGKKRAATVRAAARVLGKLGPRATSAIPELSRQLGATGRNYVETLVVVAEALAHMGDKTEAAFPAIIANLKRNQRFAHEGKGMNAHLVAILVNLDAKGVPLLAKHLEAERNSYVRSHLIEALGRVGKPASPTLPLLKASLTAKSKRVRDAAAAAIEKIEAASE